MAQYIETQCGSTNLCPVQVASSIEQLVNLTLNNQMNAQNAGCGSPDPECTFCKRWLKVEKSLCSPAENSYRYLARNQCTEGETATENLQCGAAVSKLVVNYFS